MDTVAKGGLLGDEVGKILQLLLNCDNVHTFGLWK